jgi:hypothetical protein
MTIVDVRGQPTGCYHSARPYFRYIVLVLICLLTFGSYFCYDIPCKCIDLVSRIACMCNRFMIRGLRIEVTLLLLTMICFHIAYALTFSRVRVLYVPLLDFLCNRYNQPSTSTSWPRVSPQPPSRNNIWMRSFSVFHSSNSIFCTRCTRGQIQCKCSSEVF